MTRRAATTALLLSAALTACGAPSAGPLAGAPAFELRDIGSGATVDSGALFSQHEHTFLIFWESGCPRCVEGLRECRKFCDEFCGADIAVAGVVSGEDDPLRAREAIAEGGADFMHLLDSGGVTASMYGVPGSVFSIVMVDGKGGVAARVVDPEGDIYLVMRDMIEGEACASGEDEPSGGDSIRAEAGDAGLPEGIAGRMRAAAGGAGIAARGLLRIRFLSIDSGGDDPTGPYGEPVFQGNNLLHRFELELSASLGRHLTVGGLFRAGNESLAVLRSGPDYFDSERGSAFALAESGRFDIRLGYYTIYLTPLTMMRWDWEDNPRAGGDAGCGCGPAAGALSAESLEILGPDLRFEGALARYGGDSFDMRIFYAMPRRARAIEMAATAFGGEEEACYSLETFGVSARWQRRIERTGSFIKAGAVLIGSREDPGSIDMADLGYDDPLDWHESTILSFTAEVPLVRSGGVHAEWVAIDRTELHDPEPGGDIVEKTDAGAVIAGARFEKWDRFGLRCDYLRLGAGFRSAFAALSYEPNREGFRVLSELGLPWDGVTLSAFYKRLSEIDSAGEGLEKAGSSTAGVSLDADLERGPGAGLSYIDMGEWREGDAGPFDATRRSLTGSLRYRFSGSSVITVQYQRVTGSDDSSGERLESTADLYTVFLDASF